MLIHPGRFAAIGVVTQPAAEEYPAAAIDLETGGELLLETEAVMLLESSGEL